MPPRINPDRVLTPSETSTRYRDKANADPEYRAKRLAGVRDYNYRRKYGITTEEFEEMAAAQDQKCAACGKRPKGRLHVDHDHETKRVRGLLCGPCNRALGFIEGDRAALLLEYLMDCEDDEDEK